MIDAPQTGFLLENYSIGSVPTFSFQKKVHLQGYMSSLSSFKSLTTKKKKTWKTNGQKEEEQQRTEGQSEAKKQKVDGMALYAAPVSTLDAHAAAVDVVPESDDDLPPRDEVMRKLRSRNQPVTVFGETDRARVLRLRRVEESNDVTDGQLDQQNVFGKLMEQNEGDEQSDPDLLRLLKLVPNDSADAAPSCVEDELLVHFTKLLKMVGDELMGRPEAEARSQAGRKAKTIWKQTLLYILPLYKKLAARQLEGAILEPLRLIVENLKLRNYAKCDDAYLLLAIGKAAWPMGVTGTGIHARAAQEKISTGETAHVLNDEVQRKYIQSVKRLITCSQRFFPSDGNGTTMW